MDVEIHEDHGKLNEEEKTEDSEESGLETLLFHPFILAQLRKVTHVVAVTFCVTAVIADSASRLRDPDYPHCFRRREASMI